MCKSLVNVCNWNEWNNYYFKCGKFMLFQFQFPYKQYFLYCHFVYSPKLNTMFIMQYILQENILIRTSRSCHFKICHNSRTRKHKWKFFLWFDSVVVYRIDATPPQKNVRKERIAIKIVSMYLRICISISVLWVYTT